MRRIGLIGFFALLGSGCWAGGRHKSGGGHTYYVKTVDAVNRLLLASGDSVFFRGGRVFDGTVRISASGNEGRPIWIGSYGAGEATINGGDSSGMVLDQAGWVVVRGIRLVGAGRKTGNVKNGLEVDRCEHIRVEQVDVSGFQKTGVFVYGSRDVVLDGVYAHENGSAGISVEGAYDSKKHSRDLRILNCRADDNPGDPTNLTNHSGNGIVCGHCTHLLIDHCSATNNGWDMPRIGNGPVGIWCYEADSVTIQHCLAFRNKTSPGAADGGGFDLDGGVTNSVIQYCLSYGNQGSGYCIFQYWGASPWYHNVIRYNVTEDDGLVSDSRAGIYVWNSSNDPTQFYDCQVYDNTVYNTKQAALSFSTTSARKGFVFRDNIFVGADSLIRGDRGTDVLEGNDWWVLHAASGLSGKTGDAGLVGLFVKPEFKDPGGTMVKDVRGLKGYDKYKVLGPEVLKGIGAMEGGGSEGEVGQGWEDTDGHFINAHGAGVLHQDGVYFLYGEIKKGKTRLVPGQDWEDYRVDAGGVSCYSSRDLVHWKNEGVALAPNRTDTSSDLYIGRVVERPKVIYNSVTRQYVMWMHIDRDDYGYARAGVAVSDKPEGPFRYLGSVRPNGQMSRDMTVFQDDDGRAYLVYASEDNNTMQVCLLAPDYLSPTAIYRRILIGQRREAPAVFKADGKYYLITSLCSGWDPNAAQLAVADSMLGEWVFSGNPCVGSDSATTFHSQSTFVLPLGGDQFLFMADRWNKTDLERSGYLWVPFSVRGGRVEIDESDTSTVVMGPDVGEWGRRVTIGQLALVSYNVTLRGAAGYSFIRCYDSMDRLLLEYQVPGRDAGKWVDVGNYTETPAETAYVVIGARKDSAGGMLEMKGWKIEPNIGETGERHAPLCDLHPYLEPFWKGDTVYNETVLLYPGEGRLLFQPDRVLSVRSFALDTVYREGEDYRIEGRRLIRLPGSQMPFRTDGSFDKKDLAWYTLQSQWVVVTYTHHDIWAGPVPAYKGDRLPRVLGRLRKSDERPRQRGAAGPTEVRIVAYGMSITRGFNVSGYDGVKPYMPTYFDLFAEGLRWRFPRASVRLYNAGLPGSMVSWGAQYVSQYVNPLEPDLVVIDFGMNDFWRMKPDEFGDSVRSIIRQVRAVRPQVEFLLLANMKFDPEYVADSDANKTFYTGNLAGYRDELVSMEGPGVAVMDMTTLSDAIYRRKKARDCIVNPLHPNDYLARWYAQGMLATVVRL
jgi:hypothetical protein